MTRHDEISRLIKDADEQKIPDRLYQYTSLSVLALILKNKTIRFNTLSNLDDLEESQLIFAGDNPPVTYVSCWTETDDEEIFMWNLYTKLSDGVRIELPSHPFVDPQDGALDSMRGSYDNERARWLPKLPDTRVDPEIVSMIQPRNCNQPNKVIYTDEFPVSEIIASEDIDNHLRVIHSKYLGRFKRTAWAFQKEYRYIIALSRSGKDVPLKDYYDAELTESAIQEMKIVTSPMFDPGHYILLDALLKELTDGKSYTKSSLVGKIKLK